MEARLVDILSDPDVNDELRKRSKVQGMAWLKRRINRHVDSREVFATYAYSSHVSTPAFRVVFASGCRLTAHPNKGGKTFTCNGVTSDSLAEALIGGYMAAELTDDPFDNTFN